MKIQNGLIAEFEKQSYTQVIFPHPKTDWIDYLQEAQNAFVNIINAIRTYQTCKVVCHDISEVKKHFNDETNLVFAEYETNDAWARDCSALSVVKNGECQLLDFTFNAWGNKFEATKDNEMTAFLTPNAKKIDFVLEGGAIESNGAGMLLTTSTCMHNKNRNQDLTPAQITDKLKGFFSAREVLYLEHGYIEGDDTDSHIDTLARFINADTIMYVQSPALRLMERELLHLAKKHHLRLIALPAPQAVFYEKKRLPATYANFLFVNGAVLVPTYSVPQDKEALDVFTRTFPKKKVIPIDCSVLIRQHGSLHCVTMNF